MVGKTGELGAGTGGERPPRRRTDRWVAATAVAVLVLAGTWWFLRRDGAEPFPPPRVVPLTSYEGIETAPSFSPDGNHVAFVWNGEKQDNYDIYVKQVGAEGQVRLTTDPGRESSPTWSPDGRYIAFCRRVGGLPAGFGIFMVPALGGPERKLGESAARWYLIGLRLRELAWSPDGELLVLVDNSSPEEVSNSLFLLSTKTGERRRLTSPPPESRGDWSPTFSPDGQLLAFIRVRRYFVHDLYLLAVAADGTPRGKPKRLTFNERHIRGLDWTPDGRSIVFSSDRGGGQSLWKVSVSGGVPERLAVGDNVYRPSIARHGERLVFEQHSVPDSDVRRTAGPSSIGTQLDHQPQISPDGRLIFYDPEEPYEGDIMLVENFR